MKVPLGSKGQKTRYQVFVFSSIIQRIERESRSPSFQDPQKGNQGIIYLPFRETRNPPHVVHTTFAVTRIRPMLK